MAAGVDRAAAARNGNVDTYLALYLYPHVVPELHGGGERMNTEDGCVGLHLVGCCKLKSPQVVPVCQFCTIHTKTMLLLTVFD